MLSIQLNDVSLLAFCCSLVIGPLSFSLFSDEESEHVHRASALDRCIYPWCFSSFYPCMDIINAGEFSPRLSGFISLDWCRKRIKAIVLWIRTWVSRFSHLDLLKRFHFLIKTSTGVTGAMASNLAVYKNDGNFRFTDVSDILPVPSIRPFFDGKAVTGDFGNVWGEISFWENISSYPFIYTARLSIGWNFGALLDWLRANRVRFFFF